ncbi:MAG TPA: IclR family transcriptional regulator [Burkholderiaceae bacterium]|nr:IclR family transcriptional regulator [Burkholderiaceae bacterium]
MKEALSRGLRVLVVLEKLAQAEHPQTLSDITRRTGIPKSSLMRLLAELEAQAYITRLPGRSGYVTGPRCHRLGLAIMQTPPLLRACRNELRKLVAITEETCNLTALAGMHVQYLVREESPGHLRLQLHMDIGSRVPLHCTASGKLFLALTPEPYRRQLIDQVEFERFAARTIVDKHTLESELRQIRSSNVGIDDEEFVRGMVAVAVPVRDEHGVLIAALACHAPTAQSTLAELLAHVPAMRRSAHVIAQLFASEGVSALHTV